MPTRMSFDEHGEGIGNAWTVLRDNAARAGLNAPVPTCPGWAVEDLVVHTGMVHRWATSVVSGTPVEDTVALEDDGRGTSDLLGWLDAGAKELLSALASAPDDLRAFFFLKDAPAPRFAWARRQCHETTIHAVDAMAAALGAAPTASRTWVRPALATDGVDELLCGFVPRRSESLRSTVPRTVVVRATDTGASWTMQLSDQPVVTTAGDDDPIPAEDLTILSGTAAQLYLGLWNRGDEVAEDGAPFLDLWRSHMTVSWT